MLSLLLNIISLAISFAFPALATYKALKIDDTTILKPWVIYWLVYSGLAVLEFNFYSMLRLIPFYSFIKLYLSIWLILPQTQGANFIYLNYVGPFIDRYETNFDELVNNHLTDSNIKNQTLWLVSLLKGYYNGDASTGTKDAKLVNLTKPKVDITKSYFDSFAQNFYQKANSDGQKPNTNIVKSLFGVFSSLGNVINQNNADSNEARKDVSSVSNISSIPASTDTYTSGRTANSENDFDVVENDYENIINVKDSNAEAEVTAIIKESNGWFSSWWSAGEDLKSKTD